MLMLADLFDHLKVPSDVDPAVIREAVHCHPWLIQWKLGVIATGAEDVSYETAMEVARILDMWTAVERRFDELSESEQDKVIAANGGIEPKFDGFDGNNENGHRGVYQQMLGALDLYDWFKGHPDNSHRPRLDKYLRMADQYRALKLSSPMTVEQLIGVLSA